MVQEEARRRNQNIDPGVFVGHGKRTRVYGILIYRCNSRMTVMGKIEKKLKKSILLIVFAVVMYTRYLQRSAGLRDMQNV